MPGLLSIPIELREQILLEALTFTHDAPQGRPVPPWHEAWVRHNLRAIADILVVNRQFYHEGLAAIRRLRNAGRVDYHVDFMFVGYFDLPATLTRALVGQADIDTLYINVRLMEPTPEMIDIASSQPAEDGSGPAAVFAWFGEGLAEFIEDPPAVLTKTSWLSGPMSIRDIVIDVTAPRGAEPRLGQLFRPGAYGDYYDAMDMDPRPATALGTAWPPEWPAPRHVVVSADVPADPLDLVALFMSRGLWHMLDAGPGSSTHFTFLANVSDSIAVCVGGAPRFRMDLRARRQHARPRGRLGGVAHPKSWTTYDQWREEWKRRVSARWVALARQGIRQEGRREGELRGLRR